MNSVAEFSWSVLINQLKNTESMMTLDAARTFGFIFRLKDIKSTDGDIIKTGVKTGKSEVILWSFARRGEQIYIGQYQKNLRLTYGAFAKAN